MTTSLKASPELRRHAQARATQWDLPFYDRRKDPMERIYAQAEVVLLFAAKGIYISTAHGQLRPNLSTAAVRLRHIAAGQSDPLIRAGDLRTGDTVIDCTYGLGRDAVVAAHIVGATGSLTALEASPALFYMADENKPLAEFDGAVDIEAARVTMVHADAREWLETQPAQSADIVLIDPMFDNPKSSDASFGLLRAVANDSPLDRIWVERAQRVARRWVVVKSGNWFPWFDEIGLEAVHSHGNARWFRVPGAKTNPSDAPRGLAPKSK